MTFILAGSEPDEDEVVEGETTTTEDETEDEEEIDVEDDTVPQEVQ